jgi:CRP-like cAMP-binding protein
VPREGGSIVDTGPPPDPAHPGGALRPIDVVLALRRIPVFARSPVQARLALAAISREERLEPNGVLVHASDAPAIRIVIEGELEAQKPGDGPGSEPLTICPGDAVGLLETCAGVPIGANIRVTLPGRALRISHEDFFDLLGQRADLLQSLFATLFGARRAEWELADGDKQPVGLREPA